MSRYNNADLISRQDAIDKIESLLDKTAKGDIGTFYNKILKLAVEHIQKIPSAEHKKLSNREWVDFLEEQFDISRTSAKEMLHAMMSVKREDNFKKQFSGRKEAQNELHKRL